MRCVTEASAAQRSRRAYSSPLRSARARSTRLAIVRAAHDSFVDRGYVASTMRGIAAASGVSVATVELNFKTKRELLKVAVDVAIAGDDEPVPMLQRSWAIAAEQATSVPEMLHIVTDVLSRAQVRSARLLAAAYEAAQRDPEIRDLVGRLEQNRRVTAGWIVDRVGERAPLPNGLSRSQAVDVVWTLIDPIVFLRLTEGCGWTIPAYRRWIRDSLPRLLS
jgi:AcrR family transcriptional regulator